MAYTRYYYTKGTGGSNTCSSMGINLSGELSFECVVKLNSIGFIPWGMSPDSGWGGLEGSDLRFFTTSGPYWYYDWGSSRVERQSASSIPNLFSHRIKIIGTRSHITVLDLEDNNTALIDYDTVSTGNPNGPWMFGTTNNFQFYEGKVWNGDTLVIDCKADATGLKNNLTNTYYSLTNTTYGGYDFVSLDPATYVGPYEGTSTLTYANVTGQVGAGETPDKILDGDQETKFFQWRPLPEPIEFDWSLDYPVTLLAFTIVDANDTGSYPDRVTLTTSFKLQGKVDGVWTDAYSSNSWPGRATNYGRKEIAVQTELTAQDWRILWINTGDAQVADIIFSTIKRDIQIYPDLDPQPDNTLSKFFGPLLLRRRFGKFGSTVRYERIAYIFLDEGTYYELDQLGTHYESWTVDCVFQNRGVGTGSNQHCWNWAIDIPTKRRLGCTFFPRFSGAGDCNCGWADGYGHNADNCWMGAFTSNGTIQVYSSNAGWTNNMWYRGVSVGTSNSWTRYNNYVPSIENPYSGSYNGTATQARTFGSYNYSNAENATTMTPFCLGDIRLYPDNTLSSFQYPPDQMYVSFAAWKLTISSQVIAEYLPVLVNESIPCILNTVSGDLFYPHGVTPTYSTVF